MKNPRRILIIFLVALVLHPLFYFVDPSNTTLKIIKAILSITMPIIGSATIALLIAKKPSRADIVYIIFITIFTIYSIRICWELILGVELITTDDINPQMMLSGLFLALTFVLYPIELLRPKFLKIKKIIKFLSPLLVLPFIPNSQAQIILAYITTTTYPLATLLYALKVEKKHKNWCLENYSNPEEFDTSWIKYYILGYLCLHLSYSFVFFYTNSGASMEVQKILIVLFIALVSPFVVRQQVITPREVDNLNNSDDTIEQEEELAVINNKRDIKQELIQYMEQDRPYLNPDFRLSHICDKLSLSRCYISRVLNNEFEEKFYDFTARYRIEYSKQLLIQQHKLTLSTIAEQSGFSSLPVYSRTFSKLTNQTPSEYRTLNS